MSKPLPSKEDIVNFMNESFMETFIQFGIRDAHVEVSHLDIESVFQPLYDEIERLKNENKKYEAKRWCEDAQCYCYEVTP